MESFKSGFVSIIGSPNVGKSTMMNYIIGQKISIVSHKAQTTRNKIMGVYNGKNYQIVFLDTPGITTPKNKLGEYMLKAAYETLNEVELILYLVDASKGIQEKDEAVIKKLRTAKSPVVAVINKIDTVSMGESDEIEERLRQETFIKCVQRISALNGTGIDNLVKTIEKYLVDGPQYFPSDMITDMPERNICAEMIREKTLILLKDEIPHGIGVDIEKISVRDDGRITDVWAIIYCERESHKGIIIGKGGSMLKKIGTEARHDIEWLMGTQVNLTIHVKVKEGWRNSLSTMRELGYE